MLGREECIREHNDHFKIKFNKLVQLIGLILLRLATGAVAVDLKVNLPGTQNVRVS
jgi:hypothetical protein